MTLIGIGRSEKEKLTADQRGLEEIAKIAEIAKDRRKEELTAKDAKERKGGTKSPTSPSSRGIAEIGKAKPYR